MEMLACTQYAVNYLWRTWHWYYWAFVIIAKHESRFELNWTWNANIGLANMQTLLQHHIFVIFAMTCNTLRYMHIWQVPLSIYIKARSYPSSYLHTFGLKCKWNQNLALQELDGNCRKLLQFCLIASRLLVFFISIHNRQLWQHDSLPMKCIRSDFI